MKNLKRVLIDLSEHEDKAGGAISRLSRRALQEHRKKRFIAAVVLAFFTLFCLAISAYLLLEGNFQQSRAFIALAGIGGTGGAFEGLRRIWKDYSQTDLLLILMQDASEAQVTTLINKLVKGL
jgi:hypothetical protein